MEAVLTSLEYSRPPSDSMVRKCKEIRLEHLPLKKKIWAKFRTRFFLQKCVEKIVGS